MRRIKITTTTELSLANIEGFLKRKVTAFGNSAKVSCPKEYLGKTVYLVVVKE
jgi:putative transposon-encoded protein